MNASTPGSATGRNFTINDETEPPPLRTFRVSTIAALQSQINAASAGDLIILTNGVYTTTGAIIIARQGTAQHPIVIAADTIFINSAGLRFFGDDHQIYSNYFEGCNPGIQIGNGDGEVADGAPLTSHDRPDRVRVSFNTLINNNRSVIMSGRTGGLGATALVFSNNIIQTDSGTILILSGPASNTSFEGNIVFGSAPNNDMPTSGARRIDPLLSRDSFGVFRLQSTSPAINASVGSYPEVTLDMDGQSRSGNKDVGADEFSTAPITRRPLTTANVGPNAP